MLLGFIRFALGALPAGSFNTLLEMREDGKWVPTDAPGAFQYSIRDAAFPLLYYGGGQHVGAFNTLLEMRRGVVAVHRAEDPPFNTLLEMPAGGPADPAAGDRYGAFNTLLEMLHTVEELRAIAKEKKIGFQYSIRDAGLGLRAGCNSTRRAFQYSIRDAEPKLLTGLVGTTAHLSILY